MVYFPRSVILKSRQQLLVTLEKEVCQADICFSLPNLYFWFLARRAAFVSSLVTLQLHILSIGILSPRVLVPYAPLSDADWPWSSPSSQAW